MSEYSEKFKDPRWQKKRLEMLDYSGFMCNNCGKEDEELAVHHRFYKKGADPWDYDIDELIVFCKTCHESWHKAKAELDRIVGEIPNCELLQRISGYAEVFTDKDNFPNELAEESKQIGFADALRTTASSIRLIVQEAEKKRYPISVPAAMWRQIRYE